MTRSRIALLIDADNAPASALDAIVDDLAGYGEITVRRAYGNWDQPCLEPWKKRLNEQAIRPMQHYDVAKGKNASDMALVVDAMELLHTHRPDAFAIVSSDADFTPLVLHLRERGVEVYGFGEGKTPGSFVRACTRFVRTRPSLPAKTTSVVVATPRKRSSTQQLRADTKLVALLRDAVGAAIREDGWATIGAVGVHLNKQPAFSLKKHGYANLSKLLKATELFEMRDEGTTAISVRDKRTKSRL